jgi:hypothetical protein
LRGRPQTLWYSRTGLKPSPAATTSERWAVNITDK